MYKVNINIINLGGGVQTNLLFVFMLLFFNSYLFNYVHLFNSLKLQ